jgi:FtsP/CotA-like multicopper oxidase with cupredoxin domain
MILSFLTILLAAVTATAISYGDPSYVLSPSWNINAAPTTRSYTLTLTNVTGIGPDGYQRNMIAINGQMPGPLIEANAKDTLKITVVNKLKEPTTIHWHGLYQNGSNWEDGVTGVTQCPIAPNASYTYTIQLKGQYGTFWYHSHTKLQMADGLYGPLIVHSPQDPLVRGTQFNDDIVVLVADWYHNTSALILDQLLSPAGYNNSFAAPSANSAILSGVSSTFNCSGRAPGDNVPCQSPAPISYTVNANTKTRFRLINAASHAFFRFEADGHLLTQVEADSVGITGPTNVQRVTIAAGQRASVIITIPSSDAGKKFWIRAGMDPSCWGWLAPNLNRIVQGVVRVRTTSGQVPTGLPTTSDWPSPSTADPYSAGCVDPPANSLVPLVPENVPTTVTGRQRFFTVGSFATIPPLFLVNNVSYLSRPWLPFINNYQPGGSGTINPSYIGYVTFPTGDWYDLVIANGDPFAHPYHLHSIDMHIVAEGSGNPTDSQLNALTYQTTNPLRRDTISIPANSFVVARLHTNIPGIWMMHCHVGWHLGNGFAGAIVVQPSVISTFNIPQANKNLCLAAPANNSETEPGIVAGGHPSKLKRAHRLWSH